MDIIIQFIADLLLTKGIIIAAAVFVLGLLVKPIKFINNDYIPLIGGLFGIALGIMLPSVFPDDELIVRGIYGLLLGWSATGGYETVKNLITKKNA